MQEIVLFAAKNLILILLYVFVLLALLVVYKDVYRSVAPLKKQKFYPSFLIEKNAKQMGTMLSLSNMAIVGRDDISDIMIEDEFISAQHLRFVAKKGNFFIEDLKSANGTFLNGSKVEGEKAIFNNDVIKIGGTALRFIVKSE